MRIADVRADNPDQIAQMARLLVDGFHEVAPYSWETFADALDEVRECLEVGFCRAALDEAGVMVGWVGGRHEYGYVWELHPIVVDPAWQRQGIGRALVTDFEAQVQARGGLTVILGTDDAINRTTLSGVDLYENPAGHIARAQGFALHPLEFYRKLGYTLVGVVPDAYGFGKPDIMMAKRVG